MNRARTISLSGLLVAILLGLTAYGDYENIERLVSYKQNGRVVSFECKSSSGKDVPIRLEVCTPDIIRIRMSPTKDFKQAALVKYGIVKTNWPDVHFTVKDVGDLVRIETEKLTVKVEKSPFGLSFLRKKGEVIAKESDGGMGYTKRRGRVIERFHLSPDEHFFGSNARFEGPLDMRGGEILVRVGTESTRINIPFFMSTRGYGIFSSTTWSQLYRFGTESPDYYSLETRGGDLDYYFIYGPAFSDILDRYTDITGKTPLPPKWAFGTWINTYLDQEKALAIARRFREQGLPADVFRIDSCWMAQDKMSKANGNNYKGYDALQWNKYRYPDPEKMIEQMHKMGFKFSLWNEYRVNVDCTELFKYASEKGFLIKNRDGTVNLGRRHHSGQGLAAEVDFTNPKVRKWWWHRPRSRELFDMGLDVYKQDETTFTGSSVVFHNGMPEEAVHNLYPLLYIKSAFEETKKLLKDKNRRGLIFTGCGWAGIQRYPIHWSGDMGADERGFKGAIRYVQNLGLSGVSFAYALQYNLQGFRNCQFGMFCPIAEDMNVDHILNISQENRDSSGYRIHIEIDDIKNVSEQELEIYRFYHKLRYRLLPYIYTYAYISNKTGLPIVRAMVLEYQDDSNIYDKDLQYMFGKELLVAPAIQDQEYRDVEVTRDVYLPRGKWIDYWTGENHTGPRNISYTAAIDKIPLFVKAGAIIPMQPDMNYVGEKPVDPLTLDIYPFETSSFTLYEDDGETEDYQKGAFALTTFVCVEREDGITIDIGESKGEYKGKLKSRGYILKVNQVSVPDKVKVGSKTLKRYTSHKKFERNKIGWWYDSSKKVLWVKPGVISADDTTKIFLEGAKSI